MTMIMLTAPLSGGVGVLGVLSLWNKYHFDAFLQTSLILYLNTVLYIYILYTHTSKTSDVANIFTNVHHNVVYCSAI